MSIEALRKLLPAAVRGRPRIITTEIVAAFNGVASLTTRKLSQELGFSEGYISHYRRDISKLATPTTSPTKQVQQPQTRITREPMSSGHPVSMSALWGGLERWRAAP